MRGIIHVKGSKPECLQCVKEKLSQERGFTPCECRRFCVGRSTPVQQRSTQATSPAATRSTVITCALQNSIAFNNCWNLVRDQGVGGSNPLSPTNLFKHLNVTSGFPSTS